MTDPKIVAVSISKKKGQKKTNMESVQLIRNHGIDQDAHAGDWHRQVSLLDMQSIAKIQNKGIDVHPGNFAENITTEGIRLWELPIGTKIQLGGEVLVEVTQIGKECHDRCAISNRSAIASCRVKAFLSRYWKKAPSSQAIPSRWWISVSAFVLLEINVHAVDLQGSRPTEIKHHAPDHRHP